MSVTPRILITHPGKLGDLIYSLGAIHSISVHYETPVDICISPQCQNIKRLLLAQSYISNVHIDYSYIVVHQHRGYQPHTLRIPSGYDLVYELGYRESDSYDLNSAPLREYAFFALKEFYDFQPAKVPYPHLVVPHRVDEEEEYFIFQGFGETLDVVLGQERVNSVMLHWAAALTSTKKRFLVVTGPRELSRYTKIGFTAMVSNDLFDTAILLSGAKAIVASQSVVAALSDVMQLPRMILALFQNALPQGENARYVSLLDESTRSAEMLIDWLSS